MHKRLFSSLIGSLLATLFSPGPAEAKVVKASQYGGDAQAAVEACTAGDVLVFDAGNNPAISDASHNFPTERLQIVGERATWNLSKPIREFVFLDHTPRIKQTGGMLTKCIFASNFGGGSEFCALDSCVFIDNHETHLSSGSPPPLLVNGFLRSTTFSMLKTGNHSSSVGNIANNKRWDQGHTTCILINATDPVGDGTGSLITNFRNDGSGAFTMLRILNGRGITASHFNTEYVSWSDPFITIENGVECALLNNNPGGYYPQSYSGTEFICPDSTMGWKAISHRMGIWRIAGQGNTMIAGNGYLSFRTMVTGWPWVELQLRDPWFSKWNSAHATGYNFAPGIGQQGFMNVDASGVKENETNTRAFVLSSAAACSTAYIDEQYNLVTAGLKPGAIRQVQDIPGHYFPQLPRINLDTDGPGVNMTDSTGSAVLNALNAGQTVYLGPGIYRLPGTINRGTLYGAGKDETILRFPSTIHCLEQGFEGIYNVTIEGGGVGYAQTHGPGGGLNAANVRFRGQSICGATFGNAQNCGLRYIEFDSCAIGITTCEDDIPCGEDGTPGGGSMIDKFAVYACTFKNLLFGMRLYVGHNGFVSVLGSRFEDMEVGVYITRNGDKCEGHYITSSEFVNCEKAIKLTGKSTVDNCTITTNKPGAVGIEGQLLAVLNCRITGADPAIAAYGENCVISGVTADGAVSTEYPSWIGKSRFAGLDLTNGAHYGGTDISRYVTNDPLRIDQTAPSAPGTVSVTASGQHTIVTWTPSTDAESGVLQYIIEYQGSEVGRTNYNFSVNVHAPGPGLYTADGYQGPGIYRQSASWTDSNAVSTRQASGYAVHAVNGAQIRSDDRMAMLRMWPDNVFPQRIRDSLAATWTAAADTMYVPLGSPVEYSTNKKYQAVRYAPLSRSSEAGKPIAVRRAIKPRPPGPRLSPDRAYPVFTLSGRVVARIAGHELLRSAHAACGRRLPAGLYCVPVINRTVVVTGR